MARRLHHQPVDARSANVEIEPGTDKASMATVGLLGGEAVVRMAEGSSVALQELDAAESESETVTDHEVLPVLVVGAGKPLDYEAALAVHKAIRSMGLGAARMPSSSDEDV